MGFAASDAHAFARGSTEPLSVEYAFFHAVQRKKDRDPSTGVAFEHMSAAIASDGQPLERGWPYRTQVPAAGQWRPPKDPGELFYRASDRSTIGVDTVCASLDAKHPVILVMDISSSFYQAAPGAIVIAPATEPRINTHAVIAAGYGTANKARCILIRNSWGPRWADQGYAWLHEDYLQPRLLVVGAMDHKI
jgi:hypothetical protein